MKTVFFNTSLVGSRFEIQLLANQPIEKDFEKRLEDMKITGPLTKITKLPIGTIFAASKYNKIDDGHFHIEEYIPLSYDGKVVSLPDPVTPELSKAFEDLVDHMISSPDYGFAKAKELNNQLKTHGIDFDLDKKEEELSSKDLRKSIASKYPVPDQKVTGFHISPDVWYLLIRNILRGENTMLIGPTGCGKTEILVYLAKAVAKELFIQDMGTVQDAQSALLGVHRLNDEGKSIFDPAPFVDHVQSGGIVLLDELSRAPLAANNILFPCLDGRRYLPLDIASGSEERQVKVSKDTVFFATANIGAEYSGTQAIDRALLDRFFPVELSYPTEAAEIEVLKLRTSVDQKIAKSIVKVANNIRQQFKEQELSSTISVRHTLQIASLAADGFDLNNAMTSVVMPLFEDGIGANTERAKIRGIIAAF